MKMPVYNRHNANAHTQLSALAPVPGLFERTKSY